MNTVQSKASFVPLGPPPELTSRKNKITMLALTAIGLALSSTLCVFCPALAVIVSAGLGYMAIAATLADYKYHPEQLYEALDKVKLAAFKVLGIFSKKLKETANALERKARMCDTYLDVKKITFVALGVLATGLYLASIVTAPEISIPLSLVAVGIGIFRNYHTIISIINQKISCRPSF